MKKVIRIDQDGTFLEDVILEDGQELPESCVDAEVPEGLYKPKFVDGVFVEGLTSEEINALTNVPTLPTAEERLSALEEAMLALI